MVNISGNNNILHCKTIMDCKDFKNNK